MYNPRHKYKTGRKKPEFTQLESEVFKRCYQGHPIEVIAQMLGIDEATAHAVCHDLRQKTGIKDTRDKQECIEWVRSFKKPGPRQLDPRHATPTQLDCMVLAAQGLSYDEIRQSMDFRNIQTAQNHISEGCKRASISRDQIPEYIVSIRPYITGLNKGKFYGDKRRLWERKSPTPHDPMDDPAFS